jgi:uncharacterized protein YhfF
MALWDDYVDVHPQFRGERPPVEPFGDSAAMADELLGLVIDRTKRATAGPAAYGTTQIGQHWVVTDGRGQPRIIVRFTDVRVGPLGSVDDQFAWDEGEGDRSKAYWLRAHREFFRRTERLTTATDEQIDQLATVFSRFLVVWPAQHAD